MNGEAEKKTEKPNREAALNIFVVLCVMLTNLSQLPVFVRMETTQYVTYPVWILLFGVCFLFVLKKGKIRTNSAIHDSVFLFIAICIFQGIWALRYQYQYFHSSMFFYMALSVVVLVSGGIIGENITEKTVKKIAIGYVFSTFIVEINVYYDYFRSIDAFSQTLYGYAAKNSISLLIVTSILLSIAYLKTTNTRDLVFKIVFLAISFFILLQLKSRASILALVVALAVLTFSKTTNLKMKRWLWLGVAVFVLLLVFNNRFYEIIVNNVLLANKDAQNFNAITSGRWEMLKRFASLIENHRRSGIGPYYYECAPLSAILQFGVVVGSLYVFFMFYPLISISKKKKQSNLMFVLFLIAVVYSCNALFEGLAPFGPGAKCFFLWFFWGIASMQSQNKENLVKI